MSLARDELHLAMGEFLTECSNLENILISLMMFCQDRRDFQLIHLEMLGETFGNRIKAFKRACSNYAFNAEHCEALDAAIAELDDLLPRRNFIVHGVTYEVGFGDDEPKAYRIGVPKGNIDYLNEFLRHTTSVDHSFPIERVRQATADCKFLASKIGSIVTHLLNLFVASQSKSRD